ncbi:MAG: hypothetical protein ACOY45_08730 [Pseudomonadota bacterium]
MAMPFKRQKAIFLAAGTLLSAGALLSAAAPAALSTPDQSRYQTLYSEGFYTAARDTESNICFLRADFLDGTRVIVFFSNQRLLFSVSNPDWMVSATNYVLDLQFLPGKTSARFDSLTRDDSGHGVTVSLGEGSYVPILDAMKRGSTMVAIVGGRDRATMTLAHAAGAVDALRKCDPGIKIGAAGPAPAAPRTARPSPSAPARRPAPSNPPPSPSPAEVDRKLAEAIDNILRSRSQSWIINRYDYGSVRNVTMIDNGKASGVTKVRAEYTYNGGMPGWVILESRGKDDLCLRFWDFQNICR